MSDKQKLHERRKQVSQVIEALTAEDIAAVIENRRPLNLRRVVLLSQEINVLNAAIELLESQND